MRRAVCIGVASQQYDDLRALPQCRNDVSGVSAFLASSACSFECRTVMDPDSKSMLPRLWDEIRDLGREDSLLFYFSGHGRRSRTRNLHFCTVDTRIENLVVSSVPFERVLDTIRDRGIDSVLIILDCCFSGAAKKAVMLKGPPNLLGNYEEAISQTPGLVVLSSAGPFDPATIAAGATHSDFTGAFLDVCQLHASEGTGPLSIGDVHKQLVDRQGMQSVPELFGNNHLFPVCRGRQQTAVPRPKEQQLYTIALHEAGQVLAGLDWLLAYRSADRVRNRKYSPEDIDRLFADLQRGIGSLHYILNAPQMLLRDTDSVERSLFPAFEAVQRVHSLFSPELRLREVRLHVERPSEKVYCYADRFLLEGALYEAFKLAARYAAKQSSIRSCVRYDRGRKRSEARTAFEIVYTGIAPTDGPVQDRVSDLDSENIALGLNAVRTLVGRNSGRFDVTADAQPEQHSPGEMRRDQALVRITLSFPAGLGKDE